MKIETLAAFVALSATTVSATWHHSPPFKCPIKVPEICVPWQHGGFDWHDLIPGKFEHYNGFKFSGGWECRDSFDGRKRDALLPRTFKPKCITAEASDNKASCPKIAAGSDGPKKFAITKFKVSVEFDCDLEFHYTLPNKSICKQKAHCKKSGTEIENKQCGGATDVVIIMPKPPKNIKKKTCKIGLHKIDFHCPKPGETVTSTTITPTPTPPPTPPTSSDVESTSSTKPVDVEPSTTTPPPVVPTAGPCEEEVSKVPSCAVDCINTGGASFGCAKDDYECLCANIGALPAKIGICVIGACPDVGAVLSSTEAVCKCIAKPPVVITTSDIESTSETKPVETSTSTSVTSDVETSTSVTDISEEPTVTPTVTPEQPTVTLTTVVVEETVTTCPITSTHVTDGVTSIETSLTVSTISITATKTLTTCDGGCTKPKPTTPPTSTEDSKPVPTGPATPEGPCPPVLPSCLNTWLPEECESNSDVDCFCPKKDFTKDVFECLEANGASQEEIDSAVEYFQGLCAPYVPVNPGIITDCPERPDEAPEHTKPAGPVTTIIVDTIITVPCTPEAGDVTTSSTVSTIKTQVTVPQVILTTITGGEVGVVPGTATAPPAVIASTTPAAPYPTATGPAHVDVPSVPTTLAPVPIVPVGTGGSVGTVTKPAPTAQFTGAASKSSVGSGILAAALGFAMLI